MPSNIKILVTNDDGIASPGLHALAKAMRLLGQVWVVAPDRERNAAGHALTLHKPLRVTRLEPRVFSVSGTPTDCVNLAIKKLLRGTPALVVSGINRGVNLGDDVTYSGTVSAALEGTIMGIPSIAVSQETGRTFRLDAAAEYAARIARAVLKYGLPDETLLNVNVPDRPKTQIAGVRVTALSRRRFDEPIIEKTDPPWKKVLLDRRHPHLMVTEGRFRSRAASARVRDDHADPPGRDASRGAGAVARVGSADRTRAEE